MFRVAGGPSISVSYPLFEVVALRLLSLGRKRLIAVCPENSPIAVDSVIPARTAQGRVRNWSSQA